MHELAITESILNIALSEAKKNHATSVSEIRITIGELSSIVPECVQDYFDLLSEDTVAAGAKLVFNHVPAMLKCRECGKENHVRQFRLVCPECGSRQTELISGKEFFVSSLEIDDE